MRDKLEIKIKQRPKLNIKGAVPNCTRNKQHTINLLDTLYGIYKIVFWPTSNSFIEPIWCCALFSQRMLIRDNNIIYTKLWVWNLPRFLRNRSGKLLSSCWHQFVPAKDSAHNNYPNSSPYCQVHLTGLSPHIFARGCCVQLAPSAPRQNGTKLEIFLAKYFYFRPPWGQYANISNHI